MTPKISIIFTSYNHREFLEEALNSLINQTFQDFELIIIDDCSTDGSQEILRKYSTDPRIKLHLLEKNTGSYVHSSNLGASKATADYIIFAQCDDYAEKTQLEKLYDIIKENNNVGVVFSSSNMIDENGAFLGCDFDVRENRFQILCANDANISRLEMENFLLFSCVIPNLSAALIRRFLFEKMNGLSSNYFVLADWDFWLKMSLECDFHYLREPLNNFRQHKNTIRQSVHLKRQINEIFDMYYSFFKLSKIKKINRIKHEFRIANIWLSYFARNKRAWIESLLFLQIKSIKKSCYFPVIFFLATMIYPFKTACRKLNNLLLMKKVH